MNLAHVGFHEKKQNLEELHPILLCGCAAVVAAWLAMVEKMDSAQRDWDSTQQGRTWAAGAAELEAEQAPTASLAPAACPHEPSLLCLADPWTAAAAFTGPHSRYRSSSTAAAAVDARVHGAAAPAPASASDLRACLRLWLGPARPRLDKDAAGEAVVKP